MLASPFRRFLQNPKEILGPYLRPGMTALDVGCGMGFFCLDMAKMLGPGGRVICVDIQPRMVKSLVRRASKARILDRIDHRVCDRHSLGLDDLHQEIDFALAFAIVHEVEDPRKFFTQIRRALRPGGTCLYAEPKGQVSNETFRRNLAIAREVGFQAVAIPEIGRSRTVLLKR